MKKVFSALILPLILVIICPTSTFAYEPTQTHAGLTEQIVEFYILQFRNKITAEQKELIIRGAMEEDTPPERALNHFYDPVRNIGINGYRTAKDWALVDSEWNQYSWNEVIRYYAEGNEREAFLGLGHIIHLLEDMGVPDHTRNDQHLPFLSEEQGGHSPYEDWAAQNKNRDTLRGLSERYVGLGYVARIFNDLGAYFDFLAKYSNENFFSRDTIFKETYLKPNVVMYDDEYGYGADIITGEIVKLLKKRREGNTFEIYLSDKDDKSVLSSYFDRLAAQIVPSGAGVIQLFFEEGERARKEYEEEKARSGLLSQKGMIGSLFGRIASGVDVTAGGFRFLAEEVLNGVNVAQFTGNVAATYAANTAEKTIENTSQWTKNQIDNATLFIQKTITSTGNRLAVIPEVLGVAVEGEINIPETETEDLPPPPVQPKTETPQKPTIPNFSNLFPAPQVPYQPGFGGGGGGGGGVSGAVATDTTPPDAPIILSPADFSQVFTTANITFSGTAEAESSIATDFGSATTTADVAGNWTLPLTGFSQGRTTVKFYAADAAGNVSAPASAAFFIDSIGPDVSLTVSSCADSIGASECLIATTTVALSWSSSASDLDHFLVDWGAGALSGIATSTSFVATDNTTITISAAGYDTLGNAGATTTASVRVATLPVVMNEIAWAGTSYSPYDEWIELYNPTAADISLASFTLFADDLSPYLPLSGTIPARGYYLIERKNTGETNEMTESPIADVPANLWASFGDGLNNSGERERLRLTRMSGNATTTIDEISYCRNWCAKGNTTTYGTMERFSAARAGTDWENWGTNNGTIKNGRAPNGGAIIGTPRARNYFSHLVNKNQNITNDITLAKSESPYLIDWTTLTLSAGKTLTIEPGAVIKFNNDARLVASGAIDAQGTESDPIVFTYFTDDTYGGDMNQDGICDPGNASSTAECPIAGSWFGVELTSTAGDSVFDRAMFRYGGKLTQKRANLFVENSSPRITNSIFEYAGQYGALFSNASSTISQNVFRNNKNNASSCGLSVGGGAPIVSGNTASNNQRGMCLSDTAGEIRGNTITGNSADAIVNTGRFRGRLFDNIGSGNGKNTIALDGTITNAGDILSLERNGLPYLIDSGTIVSASSTLTAGANTTFKFKDRILQIFGSFIVNGPALFTSVYDDSDGNDAYGDGASVGNAGSQEIRLESGSSSDIKDAEFRYFKKALAYTNSPISLENVTFTNNTLGISAGSAETILKAINVVFSGNAATSTIALP